AATMAGLAVALAKADLILLGRFARTPAPRESVRRPRQVDHQGTELAGNARGVRDDPDLVAEFERIALHPRIRQLRGTAPLERPSLRLAALVGGVDGDERVWIPVDELGQFPGELNLLVDVVRRTERVV